NPVGRIGDLGVELHRRLGGNLPEKLRLDCSVGRERRETRGPRELELRLSLHLDNWHDRRLLLAAVVSKLVPAAPDDFPRDDLALALAVAQEIDRLSLKPCKHRLLGHRTPAKSLLLNIEVYLSVLLTEDDRAGLGEERNVGVADLIQS